MARLLIHAEGSRGHAGSPMESALRRLRAHYSNGGPREEPGPLMLRIDDLQGRCQRAIASAGPLTDVPLPAGTYQVTAVLGSVRRSYTMTLDPDASFDLYLRFTPERP